MWFGKSAEIFHFKVFGSECFVHIPKQKRRKFDRKAIRGLFVGYCNNKDGYRVFVPEQKDVILSRDVIFKQELCHSSVDVDDVSIHNNENIETDSVQVEENTDQLKEKSESGYNLRNRDDLHCPNRFENFFMIFHQEEPKTYKEAISSEKAENWKMAMAEEMDSLKENQVWKLVPLPPEQKLIKSKWVFKLKTRPDGTIQRYKARLVIKGYSQEEDIDYHETFSPVVHWDTVRTLLNISVVEKLVMAQFDVKTAFLYGDLQEDIFMSQPQGFEDGTNRVCKLQRSLYGLKQAPRNWNKKFMDFLSEINVYQSSCDPCLFFNQDRSLLLTLYVDDGLIFAKTDIIKDIFIENLKRKFCVTICEVGCYLGLEIKQVGDQIFLNQGSYAKKVLKRFRMESCNACVTPMEQDSKSVDEEIIEDDFPFREAIGSLLYLSVVSRPDIAFAVNKLSQFLD